MLVGFDSSLSSSPLNIERKHGRKKKVEKLQLCREGHVSFHACGNFVSKLPLIKLFAACFVPFRLTRGSLLTSPGPMHIDDSCSKGSVGRGPGC